MITEVKHIQVQSLQNECIKIWENIRLYMVYILLTDPWDRNWEREDDNIYNEDDDIRRKPTLRESWESYRRRFLQYTADMLKYNPFDINKNG